jgi:hypothetical protein
MMYEDLVADFASRTRRNLDTIRALQQQGHYDVYEVTALINSMLGLLVFPQQSFMDAVPETSLSELQAEGWPVPKVHGHFEQVTTLRQMVRYLRNAIAHCNLKFLSGQDGQIAGLVVWNQRDGRRTWEAELNLDDLERIVDRFSERLQQRGFMRVEPR